MRELFYNFEKRIILALFTWLIILFPNVNQPFFLFFPTLFFKHGTQNFLSQSQKKQNLTNKTFQAFNLINDKSISLTLHTLHDLSVVRCHSESEHKRTSINHETDKGTGFSTSSSSSFLWIPLLCHCNNKDQNNYTAAISHYQLQKYFRNQR